MCVTTMQSSIKILCDEYSTIIDESYFNSRSVNIVESFDDIKDSLKPFIDETNIAISLSGGVDSMVLLDALSRHTEAKIFAFHLNYNNRIESRDEAEFLKKYCKELGVHLFIDEIDDMNRLTTNRDLYERETRRRRFQNYRYMIAKHHCRGIHLGHHSGDVVENIFTNVLKNIHHNDLSVLKQTNVIDEVRINRPFINLSKARLIRYASANDIPYFKDTTPLWSCRGQMRNEIFPKLEKCFGIQFAQNLMNFDAERSSTNKLVNELMKPYTSYLKVGHLIQLNVSIGHTMNMPIEFWMFVYDKLCENMKIKYFSRKSIKNFFENKDRLQTIVMSCDCILRIRGIYDFLEVEMK